jgi:hypothetical protein
MDVVTILQSIEALDKDAFKMSEASKKLFAEELAKSSFANEVCEVQALETPYSTIPAELTKIEEHREVLSKICEDLFGVALRPATEKELEEALIAHARLQNELSQSKAEDGNGGGGAPAGVSSSGASDEMVTGEPTVHPSEHPDPAVSVPVQTIEHAVIPMLED